MPLRRRTKLAGDTTEMRRSTRPYDLGDTTEMRICTCPYDLPGKWLVFLPRNVRQPARVSYPGNSCNVDAVSSDDVLVVNSARLLMKAVHTTLTLGLCKSVAPVEGAVEMTNGKTGGPTSRMYRGASEA